MTNIREVAKIAGVSPSTVSRVINGSANVEENKRQRVLAAIEQTGFRPNELARALYKKSSRIIGVIVPNIENPFFNELSKAIEEEAYQNGYRILLCNSNNNTEKEVLNIQMLRQMNADGIIIITHSDKTGWELSECKLPVVVVDRKITGIVATAYIESDHYKGGRMAVEHLLGCGCKNIICLRGPLELSTGLQRYLGYRDFCKEHGLEEKYIDCLYDYVCGLEASEELLRKYPEVDGIIACNDMVAIASYKVLTHTGRRVPEDVQIIGFDDIKFSRLFTPEFTTITQSITQMGTLAVQIIIQVRKGLPFHKENIFDVSLVERQTTKRRVNE